MAASALLRSLIMETYPYATSGGPTPPVTADLTFTGDLITDAVRTAGIEGDGATPPAGVGIYGAFTNLCTNGGFETNTTGWTAGGTNTVTRSTEQAKFGSASGKCTWGNSSFPSQFAITLTAAAYTASMWLYIPSTYDGGQLRLEATGYVGAGGTLLVNYDMLVVDAWQWRSITFTPVGGDLVGSVDLRAVTAPTMGESVYVDGLSITAGSIPYPYVETDGGTAAATAGRIQAPVADLGITATAGWAAFKVRAGAPSTALGNGYLFSYLDSALTDSLGLNYVSTSWLLDRNAAGVGTPAVIADTFAVGDEVLVVGQWSATEVTMSLDGAAFITPVANTNIPTLTNTDVDFGEVLGAAGYLSSAFLWVATGSGVLTNADATALAAYGTTPPSLADLTADLSAPSLPAAAWSAVTDEMEVSA